MFYTKIRALEPYKILTEWSFLEQSLAHSLPEAVFWRRCYRQMQERYEVARVKTEEEFGEQHTFFRMEINPLKGSKNI